MAKLLLVLLLAPLLIAQNSVQLSRSGVSGYVRDHGHPVPNVDVMARSNADRQIIKTNSDGRFNFFSLTPGTYRISLAKEGHLKTCVPARVQVLAGFHYNADVGVGKHC